ncbi:MAG: hypothetical protein KC549_19235, partial [Myxococcales bacterium]|nr:hypothetical protein [Myxococcales bacterium]
LAADDPGQRSYSVASVQLNRIPNAAEGARAIRLEFERPLEHIDFVLIVDGRPFYAGEVAYLPLPVDPLVQHIVFHVAYLGRSPVARPWQVIASLAADACSNDLRANQAPRLNGQIPFLVRACIPHKRLELCSFGLQPQRCCSLELGDPDGHTVEWEHDLMGNRATHSDDGRLVRERSTIGPSGRLRGTNQFYCYIGSPNPGNSSQDGLADHSGGAACVLDRGTTTKVIARVLAADGTVKLTLVRDVQWVNCEGPDIVHGDCDENERNRAEGTRLVTEARGLGCCPCDPGIRDRLQ